MSVIAQDPSVRDARGRILMARIRVPTEVLDPGPIGYRVQVVDYDATEGRYLGAHDVPASLAAEPRAWRQGNPSLVEDRRFHAQNVYALVMHTLSRFEAALGRRIGWSFGTHQLKVAPHGMLDANAFYAPDAEGLVFGYFPGRRQGTVYTCLSHDVIVHETTHALVDALRQRYLDPSSPDQAAFHEGFADVIALLSVFSQRELVAALLGEKPAPRKGVAAGADLISARDLQPRALARTALFGLAEEMGREVESIRGDALRRSVILEPRRTLLDDPEFHEPHRRGEILVAAAMNAFIHVWSARIASLGLPGQTWFSRARVAEEGADIAATFMTFWIRALDYMPPVHLEFADVLAAAFTADLEARPDDSRYGLRRHTRLRFAAYGIEPPPTSHRRDGTWMHAPAGLRYDNVRFESMRSDKDEVFRFLWENRDALELRAGAHTEVLSVRPCVRVGSDGFTLRETVAEYYQMAQLTPAELRTHRIRAPRGWLADLATAERAARGGEATAATGAADAMADDEDDAATATVYGGGTLVFDEYGKLKYHIHNDVFSAKRQSRRLEYLWQAGMLRSGRRGLRVSAARLSALHRLRVIDARRVPQEAW